MRCVCCNVTLSAQECVRRFKESNVFTDTCTKCLRDINVPTVEGVNYREGGGDSEEDDVEVFDEYDNATDEVEDWE